MSGGILGATRCDSVRLDFAGHVSDASGIVDIMNSPDTIHSLTDAYHAFFALAMQHADGKLASTDPIWGEMLRALLALERQLTPSTRTVVYHAAVAEWESEHGIDAMSGRAR
jgi:hypothetical protein